MTDPEQPLSPSAPDPADLDEERAARLQNRFDIRRLIGGLFLLYGVVLLIMGIAGSSHVKNKAAGINIDLWTGLALIAFAVFMIGWALLRPVAPEPARPRLGPDPQGAGLGS